MKVNKVRIYTDGSCIGNPGIGGYAGLILINDEKHIVKGSSTYTTNNCMELLSVIEVLNYLKKLDIVIIEDILLYTDSTYVMKGATEWIKKWTKNNWRNTDGKAVANKDLWVQILELTAFYRIDFRWVKGHAEDKYNNLVDQEARDAAVKQCAHVVNIYK